MISDSNPEPAADSEANGIITSGSENFRRLRWNEQVRSGDFVEDGKQGFELWDGIVGFQADMFVKTIYRRQKKSVSVGRASA